MPKLIDLTGKRFYKLTVTKRAPSRKRNTYWECRCDCGKIVEYSASDLTRTIGNIIKSCGCYNRDKMKNKFGEASLNRLIMYFKSGARKRNLIFTLTKDDIKILTKSNCFYCGKSPNQIFRRSKKYDEEYIYNGIDRLDNTKGYIKGNVVPCCGRCNRAKFKDTPKDFKSLIITIYNYWASK